MTDRIISIVEAPASPAPNFVLFPRLDRILADAVHVLAVGPTGGGKSTIATGVAYTRVCDGDLFCAITPHTSPSSFCGWPVWAVAGDDYTGPAAAFSGLLSELRHRLDLFSLGRDVGRPITILIDEFSSLLDGVGDLASHFMVKVAKEARKVKMRLILINQTMSVKSLGIEGDGEVRSNFTYLKFGKFARAAGATGDWPATIEIDGRDLACDTSGFVGRARPNGRGVALWRRDEVVRHSEQRIETILSRLDGSSSGSGTDFLASQNQAVPVLEPLEYIQPDKLDVITKMLKDGHNANQIYKRLGGNRSNLLDMIRQVKQQIGVQHV